MRKGDLDYIVDDNDDDLGDEELANEMRKRQQQIEDRKRTKALITAVTEGFDVGKVYIDEDIYIYRVR